MKKYLFSMLMSVLILLLTGCDTTKTDQLCGTTPNIILRIDLDRAERSSQLMQDLTTVSSGFGTVKEIASDSVNRKEGAQVFASISLSQLTEGLFPESEKKIPVYKLQLWAKDFCSGIQGDGCLTEVVYIEITENLVERKQKIQNYCEHMLISLNTFYRKNHPNAQNPVIYLQKS